jgi:light-harvesting complex II chlorophyll a/b binding protein 7
VTLGIAIGVRAVGTDDSVSTVVGLSALPVVGLSILARTPWGKSLQTSLDAGRPEREAAKVRAAADRAAARDRLSRLYGPSRTLLVSPPPAHLDGSLPADLGFDPLSLSAGGRLAAMRTYELLHARWAMLAVPGCVIPEGLSRAGVPLGESIWWKVGAAKLAGETLDYAGA